MNKYIFLDFDGVLNTENYQAQLLAEGKPGWDDYGLLFAPAAIANLKHILDAVPDVRVVVVSSFPLMIYKTSGMTLFGPISIRYTMTPSSYQSTINLKQRMYGFKCR